MRRGASGGEGMGHFTIEESCRVPRDRLFAWYTDFSGRDADLIRRFGDGSLIERKVERVDERHVVLHQRLRVLGRTVPATIRVETHPEEFAYDAHLDFGGMASQDRRYSFREEDGRTVLHMEVEYRAHSRLVKLMDFVGYLRRLDMKESRRTTQSYLRAAEAALLGPVNRE